MMASPIVTSLPAESITPLPSPPQFSPTISEPAELEAMLKQMIAFGKFIPETTNFQCAKLLLHSNKLPCLEDLARPPNNINNAPGYGLAIYLSKQTRKRKNVALDSNTTILIAISVTGNAYNDAKSKGLHFGGRCYPVKGFNGLIEYTHYSDPKLGLTARKFRYAQQKRPDPAVSVGIIDDEIKWKGNFGDDQMRGLPNRYQMSGSFRDHYNHPYGIPRPPTTYNYYPETRCPYAFGGEQNQDHHRYHRQHATQEVRNILEASNSTQRIEILVSVLRDVIAHKEETAVAPASRFHIPTLDNIHSSRAQEEQLPIRVPVFNNSFRMDERHSVRGPGFSPRRLNNMYHPRNEGHH